MRGLHRADTGKPVTNVLAWPRRSAAALAVIIAVLGLAPGAYNLALAAAFAIVAFESRPAWLSATVAAAPRWWMNLIPVAGAITIAWPTLGFPYLSDDYVILDRVAGLPTPFHAFVDPSPIYYRPVFLFVFWIIARIAPQDAILARMLGVVLLAASAILATMVLRRARVPAVWAFAAVTLWVTAPATLETVVWPSNLCGLLSATLALAAAVVVPAGRPTLVRILPAAALTVLAILSKEDVVLWPVVLVLVGARLRQRRIARWWPALVLPWAGAAAALAAAGAVTGEIGLGSRVWENPGDLAGRLSVAAARGLGTEVISHWWLPLRTLDSGAAVSAGTAAAVALGLLPLLAIGRRVIREGLFATFLLASATLPLVIGFTPFGTGSLRLLFLPGLALHMLAAAIVAGLPGPKWVRAAVLSAWFLSATLAGRWNLRAWERAAEAVTARLDAMDPHLRAAPRDAVVVIYGLPQSFDGAYAFLNGWLSAFNWHSGRPDIRVASTWSIGDYDLAFLFNPQSGRVIDDTDPIPGRTCPPGGTIRFDLAAGTGDREELWLSGSDGGSDPSGVTLIARTEYPCAVLPPIGVTGPCMLRVRIDGEARIDSHPYAPPIGVRHRSGARHARRLLLPDQLLPLPREATVVRIDLCAPPYGTAFFRSATIEVHER